MAPMAAWVPKSRIKEKSDTFNDKKPMTVVMLVSPDGLLKDSKTCIACEFSLNPIQINTKSLSDEIMRIKNIPFTRKLIGKPSAAEAPKTQTKDKPNKEAKTKEADKLPK